MKDAAQIINAPFFLLFRLLTSRKSLFIGLIVLLIIIAIDGVFKSILFSPYIRFLSNYSNIPPDYIQNIDLGYVPIVWLALVAFIIGTLVIVISFAAQNIPKLIDLYMEEKRSLFFIWIIIGGSIHATWIKLYHEIGISRDASIILNIHFLSLIGISTLPYIFHILKSTKTSHVINQIILRSYSIVDQMKQSNSQTSLNQYAHVHKILFEMLNQLDDLIVYAPFKEPKADIIQGVGQLLSYYVECKSNFHDRFFQISPEVSEDISFRTLDSQIGDIENAKTFFEQKGLRLIGNAYHAFLETDQFDLSTLCSAQLSQIGLAAIKNNDAAMVDLTMIRFNTHFRHALKHGLRFNEPRNLYNLAFHYGQFIAHLVEANFVEDVKTSFFYLRFYSAECIKNALVSPPLAFILDVLASEMSKLLKLVHKKEWDIEIQEMLLNDFLLLDNPTGMDRGAVAEFFINKNSVRVLQIGLGLYYLEHKLDSFALMVVKDTLQDLELMDKSVFLEVMSKVFIRLQVSGPNFWEDTDRGNLNIYYTPDAAQIDKFKEMQLEQLRILETN